MFENWEGIDYFLFALSIIIVLLFVLAVFKVNEPNTTNTTCVSITRSEKDVGIKVSKSKYKNSKKCFMSDNYIKYELANKDGITYVTADKDSVIIDVINFNLEE